MKIEHSMLKLLQIVATLQPTIVFFVNTGFRKEMLAYIPETQEEVEILRKNIPLGKKKEGFESLVARDKVRELTGLPIPQSMFDTETEFYDLYPDRLDAFPPK